MTLKLIKTDYFRPDELVTCPKCGGVTFMEMRQMMRRRGSRIDAGMKTKACAACFLNGDMVLIG